MNTSKNNLRHDWAKNEILAMFALPFNDLLFQAHTLYRENFDPNQIQISSLLNIKTGACSEDCGYCPQSSRHDTGLKREKLMALEDVVTAAKKAKANGASRFCMGAAWRSPKAKDIDYVEKMIVAVNQLGLETCVTLGMLEEEQVKRLKKAGLDYYNHNLDTSPEYYEKVITTRTYDDRLNTLERVREAGINVCCGGIVGMGEERSDRAGLLMQLANLPKHPDSVPINMLIKVEGTPLQDVENIDALEFVRTIAIARMMMPRSMVRLSAGRTEMSDETQALCFFAGANSIFYGEKLLTTDNPDVQSDQALFSKLGIQFEKQAHEFQTAG